MNAALFSPKAHAICVYSLLGTQASHAYIYYECVGHGGSGGPAALTFRHTPGGYRVTDFALTEDGSHYWPSLNRIFPPKMARAAMDFESKNVNSMARQIDQLLEESLTSERPATAVPFSIAAAPAN